MKIICFGSRGSLPSSNRGADHIMGSFSTTKYGGNTTCYYLEAGPFRIIFDGGSGIRECGNYLMKSGVIGVPFIHCFTHYHSDHIQGIGFCVPYYIKTNKFYIHGHTPDGREDTKFLRNVVQHTLSEQYSHPYFPVPLDAMPARKEYTAHEQKFSETFVYNYKQDTKELSYYDNAMFTVVEGDKLLNEQINWIKITTIPLNHPNGCIGYRIDHMGKSFVFCTDNEPYAYHNAQITKHANNCDMIILDGQYSKTQLSGMTQGFGHGQPELCVDQAITCGAKRLIIHHFDPNDSDEVLEKRELETYAYFSTLRDKKNLESVEFANEGTIWEI